MRRRYKRRFYRAQAGAHAGLAALNAAVAACYLGDAWVVALWLLASACWLGSGVYSWKTADLFREPAP